MLYKLGNIKLCYKIIAILGVLLCIATAGYAAAAPQLTNSMLVRWSDMKQIAPDIYVDPHMSTKKQGILLRDIHTARERVSRLFGSIEAEPVLILSDSIDTLRRYTSGSAQTYSSAAGIIIVLGPDGLNVPIISHELTHAELYHRVGKVPAWFDEGLAMMVDGRYTEKLESNWNQMTNNGKNQPDFSAMDTHRQFETANKDIISTYMLSCYEVTRWYKRIGNHGFQDFLKEIENGSPFIPAYNKKR
ncbi:hypothetical protein DFP93_101131 [Aneurinibacillus soli]|uniref:Uncharacterized protein n=1 Tax=Aneurinibacillus soli TaxID=1500254 RepID=A0A0U5BCY3_9BACL|nr:hypothetical protein [Aneurinibacillus soli]PYE64106.1 hypothetical protein DFP93_101131 [Aneurinibacillus soli]BAU28055.1 hypothetical protein CB4_02229 [Aneurinibacillus soli]